MAAPQVAAHAGVAPGGVGGVPRPVDSAQRLTGWDQHGPKPCADSPRAPALAVPLHGAVVATRLGPWGPLAAGAQAEAEARAHPAQLDPPMPRGLGGLDVIADLRDKRPYLSRDFPNGGLRLGVHDPSPGLSHMGEGSSDEAL
jgi:hypothetical protein